MKKSLLALSLLGAVSLLWACSDEDHSKTSCSMDEYEEGCSNGSYLTCEYDSESKKGLGKVVAHATVTIEGVEYKCNALDELEKVGTVPPDPGPGPQKDEPVCKDGFIEGSQSIAAVYNNSLYRCDGDSVINYKCDDDFIDGCYGNIYVDCVDGKMSQHRSYKEGNLTLVCRNDKPVLSNVECKDNIFTDFNQHLIIAGDQLYACDGSQIKNVSSKYNSACDGTKRFYYDAAERRYKSEDCGDSAHICEEYQKGSLTYSACMNAKDVTEGCGTANIYGNCDKNVLIICSSKDNRRGKTLRINCREQSISKACVMVEDDYGYDCAIECGSLRDRYNDFGTCDGNTLKYCTQSGEYAEASCSNGCGFTGSYYDCL